MSMPFCNSRRLGHSLLLLYCLLILLVGCSKAPEDHYTPRYATTVNDKTVYRFAILPQYNPQLLSRLYTPFMDYLSARIPDATFAMESSATFAAFERKISQRATPFVLANPYHTLLGIQSGYSVFAKQADDQEFRGLLLVRRDSTIHSPADLRGKRIAYPSPTAVAAAMLPQAFLQAHGIDVMHDTQTEYVGSQESTILALSLGQVDVAASWPPAWRAFQQLHPQQAAAIKIMWQTANLPSNSLMARNDVAPELVSQLQQVIFDMPDNPEGRAVLKQMLTDSFTIASNATYDSMREFVRHFSHTVRPINCYELPRGGPQQAKTTHFDKH